MRDDDDRVSVLLIQRPQEIHDLQRLLGILSSGGLIDDDDPGSQGQYGGDRHTLAKPL